MWCTAKGRGVVEEVEKDSNDDCKDGDILTSKQETLPSRNKNLKHVLLVRLPSRSKNQLSEDLNHVLQWSLPSRNKNQLTKCKNKE